MKSEFLARTELVSLPLFALFLFLAVFLGTIIYVIRQKASSFDAVSRLPLSHDEESHEHRNQ